MAVETKPLPSWLYHVVLAVFMVPAWLAVMMGVSHLVAVIRHGVKGVELPLQFILTGMALAGSIAVMMFLLRRPKHGPLPSKLERLAIWAGLVAIAAPLTNFFLTHGKAGSLLGGLIVLWPAPAYLLALFEHKIAPEKDA